ncbi:signal peptidase II [Roseomonas sp. CAU 1739]|uniref:signal peptidase II n=1 Tax=Roseomonas sp. CAU 1739 TaxID=3140364 RepID=UPI00325AA94B
MTLRAGLVTALLVLVLDQALKSWALAALAPGAAVPLIGHAEAGLSAMRVLNPGIFFGTLLPADGWPRFMVLTLVVLVAVFMLLRMLRSRWLVLNIGRGAVVGGAASNLADRMGRGAVVDYLVVRRGDVGFAFNLADIAVVAGGVLMMGWALSYALSTRRAA